MKSQVNTGALDKGWPGSVPLKVLVSRPACAMEAPLIHAKMAAGIKVCQ